MAEWKDTFGGIESKENDNIDSFTCNEIPGRKVPVCYLYLLIGYILMSTLIWH